MLDLMNQKRIDLFKKMLGEFFRLSRDTLHLVNRSEEVVDANVVAVFPDLAFRIVKMLPDNFPVVSGAELPNQFGGGYGREDQHARKARDHISAGGALSGERTAREGTDPGRAVCRYGMASQARYPSTVGGRGIGIGRAAATEPDLRSFHSRCTDCAMGRL